MKQHNYKKQSDYMNRWQSFDKEITKKGLVGKFIDVVEYVDDKFGIDDLQEGANTRNTVRVRLLRTGL